MFFLSNKSKVNFLYFYGLFLFIIFIIYVQIRESLVFLNDLDILYVGLQVKDYLELVTTEIIYSVLLIPFTEEMLFRNWLVKKTNRYTISSFFTFIIFSFFHELFLIFNQNSPLFQIINRLNLILLPIYEQFGLSIGISNLFNILYLVVILLTMFVLKQLLSRFKIDINFHIGKIKYLSIVLSSIFFILWHVNSYEGISISEIIAEQRYIIIIAVFFASIAVRYGIKASILLHTIINLSQIVTHDLFLYQKTSPAYIKYPLLISFISFTAYTIYWFYNKTYSKNNSNFSETSLNSKSII